LDFKINFLKDWSTKKNGSLYQYIIDTFNFSITTLQNFMTLSPS